MDSYVPFLYYLREVACHYKKTGSIRSEALAASEFCCALENADKETSSNETRKLPRRHFQPVECCGSVIRYASEWERHLKSRRHLIKTQPNEYPRIRKGFQPVECCGYVFKSPAHWKIHIKSRNHLMNTQPNEYPRIKRGFQPVECCGRVFKSPSHWAMHKETLGHMKKYGSGCLQNGEESLENEISDHSEDTSTFKCDICDVTFARRKYMQAHLKQQHNPSLVYKCSSCSYECVNERYLKIHSKLHQPEPSSADVLSKTSRGRWECCGRVFKFPAHLKRHQESEFHRNVFKCKLNNCKEEFQTVEDWKQHRSIVHFFADDKFNCMICEKKFHSFHSLQRHIRDVHSKSTIVECNQCTRTFTNKYGLERHYKYHHLGSDDDLVCKVCGYKGLRPDNLKHHMKIHEKSRPYCRLCHLVFSSDEALERHKIIHRPCQMCGMTFKLQNHRESHMRSHLRAMKDEKEAKRPKKARERRAVVKRKKKEHTQSVNADCENRDIDEIEAKRPKKARVRREVVKEKEKHTQSVNEDCENRDIGAAETEVLESCCWRAAVEEKENHTQSVNEDCENRDIRAAETEVLEKDIYFHLHHETDGEEDSKNRESLKEIPVYFVL